MSKIPAMPQYTDKGSKPLPPKYLEITNADGTTKTIENPKRMEAEAKRNKGKPEALINPAAPKHLKVIQKGGDTPFVKTALAQSVPLKSYDAVPHRFKAAVDSRSEAKGTPGGNATKMQEQLMNADYSHIQHSTGPRYKGGGMTGFGGASLAGVGFDDDSVGMGSVGDGAGHHSAVAISTGAVSRGGRGLPTEFGTSYKNIPNTHFRQNYAQPKQAALPRPYVPHSKHFFEGQAKLANRTTSGEILGSYRKNYVEKVNIPYTEQGYVPQVAAEVVVPVGPDNPIQPYDADGVWSACWDDEAMAVYYYNNENGEATWIPPEV